MRRGPEKLRTSAGWRVEGCRARRAAESRPRHKKPARTSQGQVVLVPQMLGPSSKLALVILCQELKARDFPLIDCQMHTPHLASLGARSIARSDFISYLDQYATGQGHEGKWSLTSWPTQHARE